MAPLSPADHSTPRAAPAHRHRVLLAWLLTLLFLALAAFDFGDFDDDSDDESTFVDRELAQDEFEVVSLSPRKPAPGGAVRIRLHGTDKQQVEGFEVRVNGKPVEVLDRSKKKLIIRLPSDLPEGYARLHVSDARGKTVSRRLKIKNLNTTQLFRNLVGGLALLLWGLQILGGGLRKVVGRSVRMTMAKLTRGPWRGLSLGLVVGAVTQAITSAAALLLGLINARTIGLQAALRVLVGSHLGAALIILALPLGISRDALWLIAIGMVWMSLPKERRFTALGSVLLGLGLLFFGLAVLREAFEPLTADPDLFPYAQALGVSGVVGFAARFLTGVILGAILQGPGALFAFVLGMAETSGLVGGIQPALQIMAGANLGAGLATILLCWPFGRDGRRLAVGHVILGLIVSAVFVLVSFAVVPVADALVRGDPSTIAYGKKILYPRLGPHLVLAFALAQTAAVLVALVAVPWVASLARRVVHAGTRPSIVPQQASAVLDSNASVTATLSRCLRTNRDQFDSVLDLLRTGSRTTPTGEVVVGDIRADLERMLPLLPGQVTAELPEPRWATVTVLHLQSAIAHLHDLADRCVEHDVPLSKDDLAAFENMQQVVRSTFTALIDHLEGREVLDLERLQELEIVVNAQESTLIQQQIDELGEEVANVHNVVLVTEVLTAYEDVGNHLYRVGEAIIGGWGAGL